MNIDFSVQEYFNELKLVEDQFNAEICLYPWVFLLLKMAECKKQEILKERYQNVSIRDVHIVYKSATKDLARLLRKGVGAPDIAVIDDNSVIGCVEVKAILTKLYENIYNEVKNEADFPERKLKTDAEDSDIESWEYENVLKISINPNQLYGHLHKFKKVLHTNGLEFYFLILKEGKGNNKKVIEVKKLANLSDLFLRFKDNTHSKNLLLEATAEWNRLIYGLVGIDWHKEPKSSI